MATSWMPGQLPQFPPQTSLEGPSVEIRPKHPSSLYQIPPATIFSSYRHPYGRLRGKNVVIRSVFVPLFVSRVFTVPKADGGNRLIIDLSTLNKYLKPISFRLPTLGILKSILPIGSWMAKIDLKDAYLHIPVNKHFQRFLVVRWKNLCIQFKAMFFGFSIAPAVFSSLMNFPLKLLRNSGVQCIAYLDDWIVWAHPTEDAS